MIHLPVFSFLPLFVFVPGAMQPGYHQQLFEVTAYNHPAKNNRCWSKDTPTAKIVPKTEANKTHLDIPLAFLAHSSEGLVSPNTPGLSPIYPAQSTG